MSFTFSLLRKGNKDILRYYQKADEIWNKILSDFDGDTEALARELSIKQSKFEWIVQDDNRYTRWEGQEIMVFSGISYFLDDGDEEGMRLATLVAEAFELSYCSLEVKGLAKRAAKLFYLGR